MTLPMSRREFVKAAGADAAAVAVGVAPVHSQSRPARRRYAIVGTGDRAISMWGRPLVKEYSDSASGRRCRGRNNKQIWSGCDS